MGKYDLTLMTVESFGIVILGLILYATLFESKERNIKTKSFAGLVLTAMLAEGLDILKRIPFGWEQSTGLYSVLIVLSMIAPFVVWDLFLQYTFYQFSSKVKMSLAAFCVGAVICGLGIIATIYYSLNGKLFSIEAGHYQIGQYYRGYMLTYIVAGGYAMVLILLRAKRLGLHDAIASLLFVLFPTIGVLISIREPGLELGVPAIVLSVVAIHTTLQAEREQKLMISQSEISRKAHTDEITGVWNRVAFNEFCDRKAEDENQFIGVIFTDMNGLKYTNDHFGHKAGDMRIVDFVTGLEKSVRKDEIYRISGDEFVVLMPGIPKDAFNARVRMVLEQINSQDVPLASLGFAYGSHKKLTMLLDEAERDMYKRKELFHERYPEYSRNA